MTTEPANPPATHEVLRAAGGLVWRRGPDDTEVLLVHRPRYDDWSLPKGKRDPGESDEDCALREVEEETGVHAAIEVPAGEVRYLDRRGRPKLVRYWRMTVLGIGSFAPNDEVDEIRWCPLATARELCTYDHDRDLVLTLIGI
ncbi:MAG: NUDIX hydrolase [Actinobacteria bacterium]|nr:NUDIX hydrolase [Actinomycetota bacterium]